MLADASKFVIDFVKIFTGVGNFGEIQKFNSWRNFFCLVTIECFPQVVYEFDEVVRLIQQERVQQRIVEQIVHVPVQQVVEGIAGLVKIIHQERISKRLVDRFFDVQVVMQRQVPTIQTVQKTVDVPQVRFFD